MKKLILLFIFLLVSTMMVFAGGSEWSPNDAVSLMPTFAPSLTAIAGLILGVLNLILIIILFKRTSHKG